jgi:hypothetical protein
VGQGSEKRFHGSVPCTLGLGVRGLRPQRRRDLGGTGQRPEPPARAEKLKDKASAVASFFDFAGKHPGEVTAEDVSRWRAELEGQGLKPATVFARVSRL